MEGKEELVKEIKSLISDAQKDKANSIEFKALEDKFKELEEKSKNAKPENYDLLLKEHTDLMAEMKALKETPKKEVKSAGFKAALVDAFAEKAEEIKSIVAAGGKQSAPLFIEVKSAVDITTENTIGVGATQYTLTENTGIVSKIRKRAEKYLAQVSVGAIGTQHALWIEETDEQGTPIFIGEGDGKTKLSVLYVEKTASVKKIAVYGKVTTEMLADLPQLISYIQNNLMKRLDIKVEDQLFSGDNIGDNLNGLETVATAFAAGAAANTIQAANEWDVLEAIATQVKIANGIPNAIFVHPTTLQAMKAVKSSTGEPLWKYYQTSNNDLVVAGMQLIDTTAVTAGNFIGGDLTVANVLFRERTNIQIGLDGNDFTNNKKTILIESRLVQFVSANDTPVVVKGDFATAKAALLLV